MVGMCPGLRVEVGVQHPQVQELSLFLCHVSPGHEGQVLLPAEPSLVLPGPLMA